MQTSHPGFQNRSGGHPRPGGHNNYNNNNFNRAPRRAPNNNNTNTAPRTGSNAIPVAPKDKSTITCYECGIVGHYSNECPKRLAKTATNTAAPAQQQRRVSTDTKFAPNNPNNRNGRLFHMNAEEAQEAPDVVLGIDKLIPCQLVPSVGIRGVKELISMARSRSSTSSTGSNAVDIGKQIETGLVDFIPHPPSRLDAYAYLEEPMEITFGKFHFRVKKEGAYRLEIPISSGLSTVDPDFSSSASSVESGDEDISSPRFISTRASEKLAKIFSDMSFESSADSYISDDSSDTDSLNFIDRSITVGKVFTNLYDGITKPNKVQHPKYHQIYAIGEPSLAEPATSEAFDDAGNPYVNPADLARGLGTKYIGAGTREMVQFPQAVWDRVARAIDGTEPMTIAATPEESQAYQYRLARIRRELEKQKIELDRMQEAASASSRRRAELS
ncbi:hypothetical protein QYE76_026925 [Lolium multiflorum]|uniref:CCHC-type domain-containing protein n=1 Tax=Lolium multiflorum TaxID=4521 RepID=A0AAD8VYG4_LOLMU|nr:hypothetical protein QYE76_026925 [Lolium multiflorum]